MQGSSSATSCLSTNVTSISTAKTCPKFRVGVGRMSAQIIRLAAIEGRRAFVSAVKQLARMSCDHQVFVGWHNPDRYRRSWGRYKRAASGVCFLVERYSDPFCVRAHSRAYFGSILANAASEHQSIEASKRGNKRTQLPTDAIDEQINRLLRTRGTTGQ